MTAAAITDTAAIAHDMQANAQRGLLWAIGLSLLAHLAVLTIQVGGDSFGWRTPSSEALPDTRQRFSARLVQGAPVELPTLEPLQVPPVPRPAELPRNTTVTVTTPTSLPRAEELDRPIPKAETPSPPIERLIPLSPPATKIEVMERPPAPQPIPKEPELVTPKAAELKTPPPAVTPQQPVPAPTPPSPVPVVEAPPPKPEVKEAAPVPAAITPPPVTAAPVTTPAPEPVNAAPVSQTPASVPTPILPAPVAVPTLPTPSVAAPVSPATPTVPATSAPVVPVATPTPKSTPQAAPVAATPATPATAATPVLTGSTPNTAPAALASPAATASPAASAAPSGGAASSGSATTGSTPSSRPTGGRQGAVVSLPAPRIGDGIMATPPGASGERAPGLPSGNIDGFDPYKSRSTVARDAARDLNNQRGRAPPSVAPSLTPEQRFQRAVADAFLPPCPQLADVVLPKPATAGQPAPVAVNQPMDARNKEGCRGESR